MTDREEFNALIELLDDKDNTVAQCVRARLKAYGSEAVDELCMAAARENDASRKYLIETEAAALNSDIRLQEFANLVRLGEDVSLFECAYLICSMLDPVLRRDFFEDLFLKCSSEYVAESSDQRTAVENIRIFNHIFFHRLHFNIYDVEMGQLNYALVSEAVRTRQGNPFAIAYIYLMMAQFAGLPLQVLSFPGGFVPAYVENGKELFYVNVYRNGEIFLKERLQEFISALGLHTDMAAFQLRDEKALLTIYLESLQFICSNNGDETKAAILGRALACLGNERFLSIDEEV